MIPIIRTDHNRVQVEGDTHMIAIMQAEQLSIQNEEART